MADGGDGRHRPTEAINVEQRSFYHSRAALTTPGGILGSGQVILAKVRVRQISLAET